MAEAQLILFSLQEMQAGNTGRWVVATCHRCGRRIEQFEGGATYVQCPACRAIVARGSRMQ